MTRPPSETAATEAKLKEPSGALQSASGARGPEPRPAEHPTVVLAVLCTAQFIGALDVFIVNVALPKIGVGVGTSSLPT
ncbi:MAG: hypothetical protein QOD76_72 [Solirubrobacteraceae bacterium]|nr:hypothetical protein [Solirubrobacteraceae bacterium]